MVFSSIKFMFIFMPIFFGVYYLVHFVPKGYRNKVRNIVLLLGSLTFYAVGTVGAPEHFAIFIISMVMDYFVGRLMEKKPKHKKLFLSLGVTLQLVFLGFFKYFNFVFGEVRNIFPNANLELGFKILLPIGISFYTFQGISYIVDVYRNKVPAEKSLINFCVYISMFEQLIAGPIVTYDHVRKDLPERELKLKKVLEGLGIFIFGVGLKVLLANPINGLWRQANTIGFESLSTILAWMCIAAYAFHIYFDFFGYSLMAIGLGQMLGFTLPKNFDFPYLAHSMTEFWRRWHMTLGSWFREYVYIPLGGNRKGTIKTIRNLLIVWLLTGVWHGAGYNFIMWGLFLFTVMIIEKYALNKLFDKVPFIGRIYMLLLIPIMWSIFAIDDVSQMGEFFKRLFPFFGQSMWSEFELDYVKYFKEYWYFFLAGIIFSTHLPFNLLKKLKERADSDEKYNKLCQGVIVVILISILAGSTYCMYKGFNDPFLYFRF